MSSANQREWKRRSPSSKSFALTQPNYFLNVAELFLQFKVVESRVGEGEEHWLRHRTFESVEELLAVIASDRVPDVVLVRTDDAELAVDAVERLRDALSGRPTRIWLYGASQEVLAERFWMPVYSAGADDVFSWRPHGATERLKLRLRALAKRLGVRTEIDHALELVRKTIDVLPHAVFIRDASAQLVFCNRYICEFIGRSEHDLIGSDVTEVVIGPGDHHFQQQGFEQVLKDGRPLAREEEWVRADGVSRWLQVTRMRIQGTDGRRYVVGLASDVTHVRSLAEQISERDQVLAQINEHMPAILFQLEEEAQGSFRLPYLSVGMLPGFEALRQPGVRGEDALARVVSEDLQKVMDGQQARPGYVWRGTFRMLDDGGKVRWMSGHATATERAEGGIRWFGVVSDMTERQLMEERLAMADRLASLGTLSSGLAHEINNPLTVITSNLDVLLRRAGKEADAEVIEEMLGAAREGAQRIGSIVERLRGVASSGEPGSVDLRAMVETAVRVVRQEFEVEVRVRSQAEETIWVSGAAGGLVQSLVNVLNNSAEAVVGLPSERQVIDVELSYDPVAARARVEVKDRGHGMSEEVCRRAVEPFFTTHEVGEGSGLGLYSSHAIVEAMGGELTLESEDGVGTRVTIILPANFVSQSAPEGPAMARRPSVLVIDDELAIVEVVARLLKQDFDVFLATSAEEALERLLDGERFEAIISDLMMPRMSGMELFTEIASRYPDQAGRMGFISGGIYTDEARRFVDERPERLLLKPFGPRELRALVQRVARLVHAPAL
ncbi:PAS domain S-box protein [Lujinxingia sediminis]|uniref:histidine kinase n=1 Tax=Lujinxingia sediminis TaxID=2480984 RepID=A0ABY0CPM1_9DELT|nr:PAS domain S-box protein [Lujinxingia sediminis]RVU42421.1 PAS domain S-box protein [Lujinxingia sediminis]